MFTWPFFFAASMVFSHSFLSALTDFPLAVGDGVKRDQSAVPRNAGHLQEQVDWREKIPELMTSSDSTNLLCTLDSSGCSQPILTEEILLRQVKTVHANTHANA